MGLILYPLSFKYYSICISLSADAVVVGVEWLEEVLNCHPTFQGKDRLEKVYLKMRQEKVRYSVIIQRYFEGFYSPCAFHSPNAFVNFFRELYADKPG